MKTAYFCKDLLPKDLIIEQLHEYDRPLQSIKARKGQINENQKH